MAVPVLICLVSATVFLVAAVDGEDDAEGEQGVLRVCDLEGVAAAERQKFTLDRRHGRAVFMIAYSRLMKSPSISQPSASRL